MLYVLAHNIRSLHNVGSIFRTSEVFGVTELLLSGYTGHPPDEKLSKVALGADTLVPWRYGKSATLLIRKLRREVPNLVVVGLENNLPKGLQATPLQLYKPTGAVLLVLGEEVSGIPKALQKQCDVFVEIPQYGKKESLNVSVAFGIAAFSLRNSLKMLKQKK